MVTDEVREIDGNTPQVRAVPIFHVDEEAGAQQTALLAVKGGDKTWYVDATGQKFENIEDFQNNNRQFREGGKLVVPVGLEMKTGADGKIALDAVEAYTPSALDKLVDPVIAVGVGLAGIAALFPTPASPFLAAAAYTGAGYLGGRAIYKEHEYLQHGGEWDDKESLMNIGTVATTALPWFSSGLRTIGMTGRTIG